MRLPSSEAITVCIPAHPARAANGMLSRAMHSVAAQIHPAAALSVAMDLERQGAPATRQRALDAVRTPYVAFCDSDDYFYPHHLQTLIAAIHGTGADYVFSYWDTKITPDILGHFGKIYDPEHPTETTITILARTELVKEVGFQAMPDRLENTGEDFRLVLGCIKLGAKIVHVPTQTWVWSHHGANTSGMPTKGDARV